ncbi:hypothetical protein BN946_scf184749.g2 [Trametes cinnabarina]|uniref:C2H2-type domain-containing protein n=1 Tax=Pycnoporus cinnabarinus TaxID=5643 RepID=A0A060T0I4_PYCCI|nr:hypothetical protein BN946_scf184749.g2 [Trametes cinnabarina]
MSLRCSGCRDLFAREADLIQHLNKSQKPACRAARDELAASIRRPVRHNRRSPRPETGRVASARSDTVDGAVPAASNTPPSEVFVGDFFGDDYTADEFPIPLDGDDVAPAVPLGTQNLEQPVTEQDDDSSDDDEEGEAIGYDIASPLVQAPRADVDSTLMDHDEAGTSDDLTETPTAATDVDGTNHSYDAEALQTGPKHVQHFGGLAGAPMPGANGKHSAYDSYGLNLEGAEDNLYAPFKSRLDWEVAFWAKQRGSGSTAFTDLLKIDGLVPALGLSYKNSSELNEIIDEKLPHRRPAFTRHEVTVQGETFDLFARDIMECIRALYGDPEHVDYLSFAPERHYADGDMNVRLYHEMNTGRWWWDTQKALECTQPGATIVPIILSSDKTQITIFRNKSAYPVYLTIGNLLKAVRRKPRRQGQILLAYLPTTRLEHISNQAARCRTLGNLFHACMRHLTAPLEEAGVSGVPMMSGDGTLRRCHPIVAVYVGDYPEQCLVTGAYTGDCPVCDCPHDELEAFPGEYDDRDPDLVLNAFEHLGSPDFETACREANIKPLQRPFWESLPYVDIFRSITPDILHQLHQGVFKHLLAWLQDTCGADELDARVSRLPPNHSIRIFRKGISKLSRVSGAEHKQMSWFLLGVITDIPLRGGRMTTDHLLRATRGLLDFLFLAQYSSHTDDSLDALDAALAAFHRDRDIFIELGARTAFNIPKLHFLLHYSRCIKLFGTTNNYNTEATERLHIDLAKDAYRATNHKDEYPQMTKWLERREKMVHHANYITWRLQQVDVGPGTLNMRLGVGWTVPDMTAPLQIKMTRHPTRKAVALSEVMSQDFYGATFFVPALARFVVQWANPTFNARQVEDNARYVHIPVNTIPVYHRVKFWNKEVYGTETVDSLHVYPRQTRGDRQVVIPARFDTALTRRSLKCESSLPYQRQPSQDSSLH